jgi:uncharacterized membrane protein YvbJ
VSLPTFCPHCGATDNKDGAFECGTQHLGSQTFRSDECRRRTNERDLRIDDAIVRHQGRRHFGEDFD